MKLSLLIKNCFVKQEFLNSDFEFLLNQDIEAITSDSRNIAPQSLFIAIEGNATDGHNYIEQAIEKGAVAVLAQKIPLNLKNRNQIILVNNTRNAVAATAATFYGNPSKDMTLVGVTGTNGKTTVTWLLESVFKIYGYIVGVIGTVNIRYKETVIKTQVTTPDPIMLHKILAEMKTHGVTHVIMEVSSHGVAQHRLDHCFFDVGIFTNLTQDHLDYHKNMEEYFACKKQFFTTLMGSKTNISAIKPSGCAVINIDNTFGRRLTSSLKYKTIMVSRKIATHIHAKNIQDDIKGLSGTIIIEGKSMDFRSQLTGGFNLENILCAVGGAHTIGIPGTHIKEGIKNCKVIPGRLEKVPNKLYRYIFVDYAHTPDALYSILSTLKKRAPRRLICIFGCGGNRDKTKRSLMGEVVSLLSDIAIVTSDNPRTEDPQTIIKDIVPGIIKNGKIQLNPEELMHRNSFARPNGFIIQSDRKKALNFAVEISKPGDIIVSAGKGHETYQITNQGVIPFDDREELKKATSAYQKRFWPMPWSVKDLIQALKTKPDLDFLDHNHCFSSISIDSRTIQPDHIFVAIKGQTFDGNNFIKEVIKKGVQAIVANETFLIDSQMIEAAKQKGLVLFRLPDTVNALGELGHFQRQRTGVKIVGITGSNGKTSTRRMIAKIFSTRFHTLTNLSNFNNEIGVPMTLLRLSEYHDWAIVEMGMNHMGEIKQLSAMTRPDIAVVTNTAVAHLEGLKTSDNIALAKAEIFEHANDNATAIIFKDDLRINILSSKAEQSSMVKNIVFFGFEKSATYQVKHIESTTQSCTFQINIDGKNIAFTIPTPAKFMVNNAAAAVATARAAGISLANIKSALEKLEPVKGRMNIETLPNRVTIIDDTYNANPASMAGALETLTRRAQSIAVLGDMLELGTDSADFHYSIGQMVARLGVSKLYLFGELIVHTEKGAIENGMDPKKIYRTSKQEIAQDLINHMEEDIWILFKGSRGMAIETIIEQVKFLLSEKMNQKNSSVLLKR